CFFQAEDGIRDFHVTGVQTCALPICLRAASRAASEGRRSPSITSSTYRRASLYTHALAYSLGTPSLAASIPMSNTIRSQMYPPEIGRASCRERVYDLAVSGRCEQRQE